MRIPEDSRLLVSDKLEVSETKEDLDKKALVLLAFIILLAYVFWVLVAW
jgi:hypothetical protein